MAAMLVLLSEIKKYKIINHMIYVYTKTSVVSRVLLIK
jgi:hypothetical protein